MKLAICCTIALMICFVAVQSSEIHSLTSSSILGIVYANYANDTSTNGTQQNQTQALPFQNDLTIDRPFYSPTKIIVSFPATNNWTVGEVTTISQGTVYNFSTSPTQMEFLATDIDVYTFTFSLVYQNSTSRNILIAIWQGDLPLEGYTWVESDPTFAIHFTLNLLEEPRSLTAEQIAQASMSVYQQMFQTATQQLQQQEDSINSTLVTYSTVGMMSGVTSLVAIVIAYFALRRRKIMPEG